jgi:Zn-dependent protease with chaperone function
VKIDFDVGGAKTLRQSMDVARFLGYTKAQARADDGLQSNPTTSPTLGLQWNLATQSSVAQTSLSVVIDLEITYDVLFFSRASVDLAFEKKMLALVVEREQNAAMRRQTPRTPQLALAARYDQGDEEKLRPLETKQPVAFTFGGSPPVHIVEQEQAAQYQPPLASAKAAQVAGKGYVLLKAGSAK